MDVGAKRTVAFAKYMKAHGWEPFVLSVKNPDRIFCVPGNDLPPEGVHTEYSRSIINFFRPLGKIWGALGRILQLFKIDIRSDDKRNYLYDIFCIPDIFIGWIPLTIIKAYRMIKKYNIDVIYVSCSPFSAAIIGIVLRRLTKKPLVVDFRDPFALLKISILDLTLPRFRIKINEDVEKKIIKNADIFVVNTEETRKGYYEKYPQFRNEEIYTLHNGFDQQFLTSKNIPKFEKFTIIYTGEFYFYAPQLEIFTKAFYKALALLKEKKVINASNFQFLFYGDSRRTIEEYAQNYNVTELVHANPRIPYQEVLKAITKSHLQLLRIIKPMLSTKLFEGISLNIPFLATVDEGEAVDLLKKYSPGSFVSTTGDPEKVAEAILNAMDGYKNNRIKENNVQEFLSDFSREKQTLKLMDIIQNKLQLQKD